MKTILCGTTPKEKELFDDGFEFCLADMTPEEAAHGSDGHRPDRGRDTARSRGAARGTVTILRSDNTAGSAMTGRAKQNAFSRMEQRQPGNIAIHTLQIGFYMRHSAQYLRKFFSKFVAQTFKEQNFVKKR